MKHQSKLELLIAISLLITSGVIKSEVDSSLFTGTLAYCEIKSFEDFDPKDHPNHTFPAQDFLVQKIILSVKSVYYGAQIEDDFEFSYASHGVSPRGNPSDLTTLGFQLDVGSRDVVKEDSGVICLILTARDYGPPPANKEHPIQEQYQIEHFMKCPKYSIFYVLFKPLIMENEGHPGLYKAHLDWARAIQRFDGLEENDRVKELVAFVEGKNPLLAVHAIHLLARLYPTEAEKRFVPWLLSGNLTPEACLAIDQESCIRNGQIWGESDARKGFAESLQNLKSVTMEGTVLTEFYQRAAPRWLRP